MRVTYMITGNDRSNWYHLRFQFRNTSFTTPGIPGKVLSLIGTFLFYFVAGFVAICLLVALATGKLYGGEGTPLRPTAEIPLPKSIEQAEKKLAEHQKVLRQQYIAYLKTEQQKATAAKNAALAEKIGALIAVQEWEMVNTRTLPLNTLVDRVMVRAEGSWESLMGILTIGADGSARFGENAGTLRFGTYGPHVLLTPVGADDSVKSIGMLYLHTDSLDGVSMRATFHKFGGHQPVELRFKRNVDGAAPNPFGTAVPATSATAAARTQR